MPPKEYFSLEKQLFVKRYAICPSCYRDFKMRFRRPYLRGSCYDGATLCGLIFIDELIENRLYYLRVIGLLDKMKGKGVGKEFFRRALPYLPDQHWLGFVTEARSLIHMISVFYCPIGRDFLSEARKTLYAWNTKLIGKDPNGWITGYYLLRDGSSSSGFWGLMERRNNDR